MESRRGLKERGEGKKKEGALAIRLRLRARIGPAAGSNPRVVPRQRREEFWCRLVGFTQAEMWMRMRRRFPTTRLDSVFL